MKKTKYRFYLEGEAWYIDLPEYIEMGGDKADLQMVLGADDLLNYLSNNSSEIELELAVDKKGEYYWDYIEKATNNPVQSGATYVYQTGVNILIVWLCDVVTFLFGDFPEVIYFRKVDSASIKALSL